MVIFENRLPAEIFLKPSDEVQRYELGFINYLDFVIIIVITCPPNHFLLDNFIKNWTVFFQFSQTSPYNSRNLLQVPLENRIEEDKLFSKFQYCLTVLAVTLWKSIFEVFQYCFIWILYGTDESLCNRKKTYLLIW